MSSMKRWGDIAALYERAAEYANESLANKLTDAHLKDELKNLLTDIDRNKFTALANSILDSEQPSTTESTILYPKSNQKQKKVSCFSHF